MLWLLPCLRCYGRRRHALEPGYKKVYLHLPVSIQTFMFVVKQKTLKFEVLLLCLALSAGRTSTRLIHPSILYVCELTNEITLAAFHTRCAPCRHYMYSTGTTLCTSPHCLTRRTSYTNRYLLPKQKLSSALLSRVVFVMDPTVTGIPAENWS